MACKYVLYSQWNGGSASVVFMITIHKHIIEIELSRIELKFAHIRIANISEQNKLLTALNTHGQLTPVIVVQSAANQFTLIDGYLRINALKKLKQDTVLAEVWDCCESDALLRLLTNLSQRPWEAFEQASAFHELQERYHLSQEQIASKIGKTKSFVSRRLSLLADLSEQCIQLIMENRMSVWAANRVLIPVARANKAHADKLLEYLSKQSHSTRELSQFFKHYQKSNHATREKMVNNPELFFKAQKSAQNDQKARWLKAGPEGQWQWILANISDQIKRLEKLAPELFYERQDEKMIEKLKHPLMRIQNDLARLLITSQGGSHDRPSHTSNHYHIAPIRQELPTY